MDAPKQARCLPLPVKSSACVALTAFPTAISAISIPRSLSPQHTASAIAAAATCHRRTCSRRCAALSPAISMAASMTVSSLNTALCSTILLASMREKSRMSVRGAMCVRANLNIRRHDTIISWSNRNSLQRHLLQPRGEHARHSHTVASQTKTHVPGVSSFPSLPTFTIKAKLSRALTCDERKQRLATAADGVDQVPLCRRQAGFRQQLPHRDHAVQRRADLVTHARQELRLGLRRNRSLQVKIR